MDAINKLTNYKYLSVISTVALTFIGIYFFHWTMKELFTFYFIQAIVRSGFIINLVRVNWKKELLTFTAVYLLIFAFYSLIFYFLIRFAGQYEYDFSYGGMGSTWLDLMLNKYGAVFAGVILVEFISYQKSRKRPVQEKMMHMDFLIRQAKFLFGQMPILWALAAAFKTVFLVAFLGRLNLILILALVAWYEFYWVKRGGVYSLSKEKKR